MKFGTLRLDSHPAQAILKIRPEFPPEIIAQFGFIDSVFHPIQINRQTKKTIPGEWLGFSGQDACKSRFWTTCTQAKQTRFSGYACILARVTGALDTDVTEIEKRDCASYFGAGGWKGKMLN
ncbi:hypothetical protein [Vibrio ruber]|uniref:hypothetical protein n=1 Tax=Vibrio ruber TaxID=184755 RepID=UPI00098595A2|nr:hypothetical protein [Vibrio ruber]